MPLPETLDPLQQDQTEQPGPQQVAAPDFFGPDAKIIPFPGQKQQQKPAAQSPTQPTQQPVQNQGQGQQLQQPVQPAQQSNDAPDFFGPDAKIVSDQSQQKPEPTMLDKVWGRMNEPVKMEEVEKIPGLQPDVVADLESKGLDTLSSWFGKEHGEYIKESILHGFTPEVFARGAAKSLTDWFSPVQMAMRGPSMVAANFAKEAKVAEEAGQGVEAYRLAHKAKLAGTLGAAIGAPLTAEQTYHLVDNWEDMKPWERTAAIAGVVGGGILTGVGVHEAGGPRAVAGQLGEAAKMATGVVTKPAGQLSAAVQKAVGVGGGLTDLVYNASKPSKGKAQEYYQTVKAAEPQLTEILQNNPKISTPQEAYDAIQGHIDSQENKLRSQARDLQGPNGKPADDAILEGTEDDIRSNLHDYFKEHAGAYKAEDVSKATEEVVNRIRQGEEGEPRDPSLFEGENLRRQLNKETAPVFASETAVPSALRDAKIVATGVLKNKIDTGYEKIGVKGVKEWRQQEAPLIEVKDQLSKAFQKSKEMGDWNLIESAIRSAGWGGLGAIVGHVPGGLAGEAIGIAKDYVRDRLTNPNRKIQQAVKVAAKETGPSGAINPTISPGTPGAGPAGPITPGTPPVMPGVGRAKVSLPERPKNEVYTREPENGRPNGEMTPEQFESFLKETGTEGPQTKIATISEKPTAGERLQEKLDTMSDEASARLKTKMTDLHSGIDPTMMVDLAIIGAAKIVRGARTFSRFSQEMISDYGDRIKPHLEEIYNTALGKAKNPIDSGRTPIEPPEEIADAIKNTGLQYFGSDDMGLSHFHDPVTNHTYSLLTDRVNNETLNARMAAKEPPPIGEGSVQAQKPVANEPSESDKTAKIVEASAKVAGAAAAIAAGAYGAKAQDKAQDKNQKLPSGMVKMGNIDVNHRPVIHNDDGSVSTIFSSTIPLDKDGNLWKGDYEKAPQYALVPTISGGRFLTPDGKLPKELSKNSKATEKQKDTVRAALEDTAGKQYQKTKEHLGIFKSDKAADDFAEQTHSWFATGGPEKVYLPPAKDKKKTEADALTKTLTKQKLPDSIEEVVDGQGRRFFKKDGQWVQYTKADQGSTVNTRPAEKGK